MALSKKRSFDINQSEQMNLRGIITPSCTSITILGQLLLLSKEDDFRLVDAGKKVEHIKHPESFRACLMQLTHESWSAFNTAERNMNRVLQNVNVMPKAFASVNEILVEGEQDDIVCLVPGELNNISRAAEQCMIYTTECEKAFEDVRYLIEEIVELCNVKDITLNDKLSQNKGLKDVLSKKELHLSKQEADLKKERKRLEAEREVAKSQYDKALDSQPGALESLLGGLLDTVSDVGYLKSKKARLDVTQSRLSDVQNQCERFREKQLENEKDMLQIVNELTKVDRSTMSVKQI